MNIYIMNIKAFLPAALLVAFFFSCGEKDQVNISQKRNNVIDICGMIEEFPVEEVLIHSGARLFGGDRYLYIEDAMSTDKITSVFSIPDGRYIGQFMDFGAGPNEIAIMGGINLVTSEDDGREKAIVIDHGNYRTSAYDVDSALTDPTYAPRIIKPIDKTVQPSHYVYVNDTLGFTRKITIRPGSTRFGQALGKYNLLTGEITDFAPEEHIEGNRSLFDVSKETQRVVEVGANVDIVVIYDYEGNVLRRIKGPNYKPVAEGWKSYFSDVKIAGPYILGVYSGGDWNTKGNGKRIEVLDIDGNYIATLDTGREIMDMYYHKPSGILWFSFLNDDMQFGTLNLEEALKQAENKKIKTESAAGNEDADNSGTDSLGDVPPFIFLSKNLQDTLTRFDIGVVRIPKERLETVFPDTVASITIASGNFNDLPGKVDKILFEPTTITPSFLNSRIDIPFMLNGMITLVRIGFTKDAPEGDFQGVVEVPAKGFDKPLILPVSGTIVYD